MATNNVHLLLSVDFPVADFTIYPSANLAGDLAAPVITGEITAPVIWGELAAPESITGDITGTVVLGGGGAASFYPSSSTYPSSTTYPGS